MRENSITPDGPALAAWARELGFHLIDVVDVRQFDRSEPLAAWLAQGFHGEMSFMAREPEKRAAPPVLVPGTRSAIVVALDYAPHDPDWVSQGWQQLARPGAAYVSSYARGRDYHKLIRNRLQKLADKLTAELGPFGYRAFCDSAPVMEVALAERAGLGWRGKHTLLLNRAHGSMMFLGTLFTDLPVAGGSLSGMAADLSARPLPPPARQPAPVRTGESAQQEQQQQQTGLAQAAAPEVPEGHCGSCRRCLDVCPTQAIVAPYRVDARRCISYLTIELKAPIPVSLRPLIGNRIYGCDDCQLACPWNKYAQAGDADFAPRHGLENSALLSLFAWDEQAFDLNTRGSAIRRIGHERWLRNIAVALGNLVDTELQEPARSELFGRALTALRSRLDHPSELVREHIVWAIKRLEPAA